MRPHIDVDASLHEKVKTFKQTHTGVDSLSEAYTQLITTGLDDAATTPTPATDALPTTGTFTMASETDDSGINSMLLYSLVRAPTWPFATTIPRTDGISKSGLRDMLYQLSERAKSTSYPSVMATLSQADGEWVVGGAAAIFNAIQRPHDRWDAQPEWECHRSELVTILAKLTDDYTAIVTGRNKPEQGSHSPQLTDVHLTLLSNGHPVTGDRFVSVASDLGFPEPHSGAPVDVESATLTNIETTDHHPVVLTPDDIRSRITYTPDAHTTGDKWVCGAVVDNPFTHDQLTRAARLVDVSEPLLDTVCDRKKLVVNFLDTHPADDDTIDGYTVDRLRILDLTETVSGAAGDIVNATVDVRYRTDLD